MNPQRSANLPFLVVAFATNVDLANLNAKLNSLESKVNQIINVLQTYGLFDGA
jgi:hypothetical protein